jgi:hypothetical protein
VNLFRRCAAVLAAVTVVAGGTAFEAQAATSAKSASFGPTVITDIPKSGDPPIQKVVPLGTIETTLQAGKTAYVYSTVTANNADHVNLIDNEVLCSGAGRANVVMGENVFPKDSGSPLREITIVTRFLVTATSAGKITCNQFLRTSSTSEFVSRETVKSEMRFASEDVIGDVNGAALQRSLPPSSTPVNPTATTPVLSGKIPAGLKQLAVIADVEYHRCSGCSSTVRFALTVTTSGGASCPSAPVAQIERTVQPGINHVAAPLYTKFPLKAGCTDFQAKVTSTTLAGGAGSIGGEVRLPDKTGPLYEGDQHDSAMTHIFAVPS